MEEIKEKSAHHTALQIYEDMQQLHSYRTLYSNVQKLACTQHVNASDFRDSLLKAIKEHGIEAELRNNVYHWVRTKKKDSNCSLDVIFKKAQIQWDKRVHKSLNSMCSELGISLARLRHVNDREEILEKWGELSKYDVDIHKYRPVYAPKDFFDVVINLRGPNYIPRSKTKYCFSHLPIKVKDLSGLRSLYSELSKGEQVLGINLPNFAPANYTAFEMDRILLGEKVLMRNYAPVAQEYLKRGCPHCLRAQLWTLVLGAEVKPNEYDQFDLLKSKVLQYDLMIDKLIIKDIHLTASNDDQYFVFEDVLYQIMLCFSRDSEILNLMTDQTSYMQVVLKGKQQPTENTLVFPPSGIIPFHGFSMYAAPFCYLFEDHVALYYVFRAFYLRYFHRLHKVCASAQGIVALSLLFERLLQGFEPSLWSHFKKHNIPPIRVVFKWLMKAFSGHLPPEQLLNLWDLILAYDSLEIVPLLAVVIVVFRKENLMKVTTLQNIEAVLADLSSIAVIPLLQMALLKD